MKEWHGEYSEINSQKVVEENQRGESEDEEVKMLMEKMGELQKNYVKMEKQYTEKIKRLYLELNDKNSEYSRLKKELAQLRKLGCDHTKKVEELLIKHKQNSKPRLKSISPVTKSQKSIKRPLQNIESSTQQAQSSATIKPKSTSPKGNQKKLSPPVLKQQTTLRKRPMFPRNNILPDSTKLSKSNGSPENSTKAVNVVRKISPKRVEPKLKSEQKEKVGVQVRKQGIVSNVGSYRQKVPVFK